MASNYFGSVPGETTTRVIREEAVFVGSDFEERWDEMNKAYYAFAYPTPGWNHPDAIPLMFFHQLLGEWDLSMGSAENTTIPLARTYFSDPADPWVDKYFAFNTLYHDIGLFGVYLQCHPYRLLDSIH